MLTHVHYASRHTKMSLETFFLIVCTFSFLVVSVALAGKFVVEAYLEYIQVKTGIYVMQQMLEEEEQVEDDF
jgi:hypothetical protein